MPICKMKIDRLSSRDPWFIVCKLQLKLQTRFENSNQQIGSSHGTELISISISFRLSARNCFLLETSVSTKSAITLWCMMFICVLSAHVPRSLRKSGKHNTGICSTSTNFLKKNIARENIFAMRIYWLLLDQTTSICFWPLLSFHQQWYQIQNNVTTMSKRLNYWHNNVHVNDTHERWVNIEKAS